MNLNPIVVNLHGLALSFSSPASALLERFGQVYGHLPRLPEAAGEIIIHWTLTTSPAAPLPAAGSQVIVEDDLVSYYRLESNITIRMPRYGLMEVDLANGQVNGTITANCLEVYGAFEDVLMIALAPLFRRRGWFPLHAFAALAPDGLAVLISGQMGAGKTTTGLALLKAGWKLLSNDSPLLALAEDRVQVLAYPGHLSAFDDSLARFPALKRFIVPGPAEPRPVKRIFRVEDAFADPWAETGPAGGVFFPQVTSGLAHSELVRVPPAAAVVTLMPQAVEGWDRSMTGPALQVLSRLVAQVPCYTLRLAPQVEQLPGLIAAGLEPGWLI